MSPINRLPGLGSVFSGGGLNQDIDVNYLVFGIVYGVCPAIRTRPAGVTSEQTSAISTRVLSAEAVFSFGEMPRTAQLFQTSPPPKRGVIQCRPWLTQKEDVHRDRFIAR